MLANKHALFVSGAKNLKFNFSAGTHFGNISSGIIVEFGNYDRVHASTLHGDWAIVKLERNLAKVFDEETGKKIGYLPTRFLPEDQLMTDKDLSIVGLIGDDLDRIAGMKIMALKRQSGCRSLGYAGSDLGAGGEPIHTGTMGSTCSSLPGTSGAPVLKFIDGIYFAVGIQKNGKDLLRVKDQDGDGETANLFIPFVGDPSVDLSLKEGKLNKIKIDNPCA